MAELKTKPTSDDVGAFINKIDNPKKQDDCRQLVKIMEAVTGQKPVLWGASIVGFGTYHYKYASGREGDWLKVGFSPRKQNLTIYIMDGVNNYPSLLKKLGKYKTAVSCLYVKTLDDIDTKVLKQMIAESIKKLEKMYPDK